MHAKSLNHVWLFSHVWLFATPQTVDCKAPPSMGLSRQEHWSSLPCPSPIYKVCVIYYGASQVVLVVKNLPAKAGDTRLVPGWRRFPGGRHVYPLQYSCLESSMDRGAWRAIYSSWGPKESDTTEQLSTPSILWLHRDDPWHKVSVNIFQFYDDVETIHILWMLIFLPASNKQDCLVKLGRGSSRASSQLHHHKGEQWIHLQPFSTHNTILFFTSSIEFNELHDIFNTLLQNKLVLDDVPNCRLL